MSKRQRNSLTGESEETLSVAEERLQELATEDRGNGNGEGKPKIVKSRRERFLSQAERRVNNALKRLSQVANLGNRTSYEATEDEYGKILSALGEAYAEIRQRFTGGQVAQRRFTL